MADEQRGYNTASRNHGHHAVARASEMNIRIPEFLKRATMPLARGCLWSSLFMPLCFLQPAMGASIWLSPKAPYPPAGMLGAPDLMKLFEEGALWPAAMA